MSIYKTSVVTANTFNEAYIDFIKVGSPMISSGGIASGFTNNDYLQLANPFNPESNTWSIFVKVKTGTIANSSIFGNYGNTYQNSPEISIDSSKWLITISTSTSAQKRGTYTVLQDMEYWLRLYFTGSSYNLDYSLDGITFINDIVIENNNSLVTATEGFTIGHNKYSSSSSKYWRGSIDLNSLVIEIGDKVVTPELCTISKYRTTANNFYEN